MNETINWREWTCDDTDEDDSEYIGGEECYIRTPPKKEEND